jgi:hypothetical protein
MAGDHKCSVCQATFTRPQHVSRHMRSRKLLRYCSSRPAYTPTQQIPAIAHTSVSIVETSSPEGLSSLHLPSPAAPLISISPLCYSSQAISSRDTSTNAIPTRNLSFLLLLLAGRAPLLPAGPPRRSKPVTNVSSLLCHVMGPILVVSDTFPPP